MLTYIGSWFNMLTLVILAWIALFATPKLYQQNQEQVDQVLGQLLALHPTRTSEAGVDAVDDAGRTQQLVLFGLAPVEDGAAADVGASGKVTTVVGIASARTQDETVAREAVSVSI